MLKIVTKYYTGCLTGYETLYIGDHCLTKTMGDILQQNNLGIVSYILNSLLTPPAPQTVFYKDLYNS